jgi:formamidopyrimidine-DNA glycosylase
MPEIPDLEGYRAYFNRRLPGLAVESAEAPIAWMIRTGGEEFARRLPGQVFRPVERRAKHLLFPFQSGDCLVVHAMLTGRFQYSGPAERRRAMTAWALRLSNGMELRYSDERRMGRTYLLREDEFAAKVPGWADMGPDVMDPSLTAEAFVARLKTMRAQIKTVLTTERCVAGIGNAYADEVLWEAGIHPYRKRADLSDEELAELFRAVRRVMEWASGIVAQRMEDEGLPADHYRDHLRVHRRGGEVCPRCGHRISEITSGQRITNFCRGCQA